MHMRPKQCSSCLRRLDMRSSHSMRRRMSMWSIPVPLPIWRIESLVRCCIVRRKWTRMPRLLRRDATCRQRKRRQSRILQSIFWSAITRKMSWYTVWTNFLRNVKKRMRKMHRKNQIRIIRTKSRPWWISTMSRSVLRRCLWRRLQSTRVHLWRCRMDVISSAATVLSRMREEGSEAEILKVCWKRSEVLRRWVIRKLHLQEFIWALTVWTVRKVCFIWFRKSTRLMESVVSVWGLWNRRSWPKNSQENFRHWRKSVRIFICHCRAAAMQL